MGVRKPPRADPNSVSKKNVLRPPKRFRGWGALCRQPSESPPTLGAPLLGAPRAKNPRPQGGRATSPVVARTGDLGSTKSMRHRQAFSENLNTGPMAGGGGRRWELIAETACPGWEAPRDAQGLPSTPAWDSVSSRSHIQSQEARPHPTLRGWNAGVGTQGLPEA